MPWPGGTPPEPAVLAAWLIDSRRATLALVEDLGDDQLLGPRLSIINPFLWEIGHAAWFQEKWLLRHAAGEAPLSADADRLYDSAAVAHDTRWDLPLPSRAQTLDYMRSVLDRVLERLARGGVSETESYFALLSTYHEDMHTEAFTYTRQTLGYPRPEGLLGLGGPSVETEAGPLPGDVEVPGGRFVLGAEPGTGFVFDNEKWGHGVEVAPFAIARAAVTQGELAAFVEDGGYRRRELWSEAGWAWREREGAEAPLYWRRRDGGWERRDFDRWVPLEPHRAAIHVGFWEAEAWCRWAGRRLPTELEWEVAAAGEPDASGRSLAAHKRRYPWGDEAPTPERGQLDFRGLGRADVAAFPAGDSAFGCRQMLGNAWEWTATDFGPYPGFVTDPYKEYSAPWFSGHKVLRGGAWTTRARLLRNTWRNFYPPNRRDVWAGFRTCRPD